MGLELQDCLHFRKNNVKNTHKRGNLFLQQKAYKNDINVLKI